MGFLYEDQYEGCPTESFVESQFHTPAVADYLAQTAASGNAGGGVYVATGGSMPTDRHVVVDRGDVGSGQSNLAIGLAGLTSLPSTLVFGFHFRVATFPSAGQFTIAGIGALLTNPGNNQVGVVEGLSSGALKISGLLTSASGLITPGTVHHLQVKYVKATKTWTLRLDGADVLTGNVPGMPAEPVAQFYFRSASGFTSGATGRYQLQVDNIWAHDTDFQGVLSSVRLPLSTTIGTPAFVPQGGATTNLDAVNKRDLSTATYNQSTSANDVGDYFGVDTSGITGANVKSVCLKVNNRKAAVGERKLNASIGDGSNTFTQLLPDSTANFSSKSNFRRDLAPDGAAWDVTKVGAAQFGYKVTA